MIWKLLCTKLNRHKYCEYLPALNDFFSIEIQFLNLSILTWSCVKIQHDFKLCSFWLKNCIWRWIKNNLFEALMEWFQANNFKNSIEWKFYWFFSRSIKLLEYWPCNVHSYFKNVANEKWIRLDRAIQFNQHHSNHRNQLNSIP